MLLRLRCSEKSNCLRQAATVFGLAASPCAASAWLTERVLLRVHFRPAMGSPAVSSTSSASIRFMSFF